MTTHRIAKRGDFETAISCLYAQRLARPRDAVDYSMHRRCPISLQLSKPALNLKGEVPMSSSMNFQGVATQLGTTTERYWLFAFLASRICVRASVFHASS
jgi:hypothetical protein